MRGALAIAIVPSFLLAFAAGCASPPPPKPTYTERITLLPNKDGRPSSIIVKRASGEQQLSTPGETVVVEGGEERRLALSSDEIQQRYGETLAAQPARPLSFVLFFALGTTELTAQSRAQAQELQRSISAFPAPQVSVIGHTDATGTVELNDSLSLQRALAVRQYLIGLGIPSNAIDAVGRGSRELLVPTKQGVAEERNRRVEVRLR